MISSPPSKRVRIGYHASHEQFSPSDLLSYVRAAEAAGFDAGMCSDHFFPWSRQQGNSGLAMAWLGAALQATTLSFGTVCAPGQRYHPAIVAQGFATLGEMFPGRVWVALGSGQNLNEHITGDRWPAKAERNERLLECVEIIRALWAGETVSHSGHVVVDEARLFTRASTPPMIVAAAITPETARWAAGWADALITISRPAGELRRVVEAFREGGGEGKPMMLQVQLSFAPTEDEARRVAMDQWGTNVFDSALLAELRTPEQFEAAAEFVTEEDVAEKVLISADPHRHVGWLEEYAQLGFDDIYLHNVHRDQQRFIEVFGEQVLPEIATPHPA